MVLQQGAACEAAVERRDDRTTNMSGEAASCCCGSVSIDMLNRGMRDECLFLVTVEPDRLVELECGLAFAARQEHDLVAIHRPGMRQGPDQHGFPIAAVSMVGVRHDVLDETIGLAPACEIRNHGERARGYQRAVHLGAETLVPRTRQQLSPRGLHS